jgi:DNA-binding transcriptional LysR family regulator
MNGYDLADLRLLHHVVETGSITAGAERSFLSLAAASMRLRGMEETLGVRLFDRKSRGVEPTKAGWIMARHAQSILGQAGRMEDELREHAQGLTAHVRLLCNSVSFSELLPERLCAILAEQPRLSVELEERPSPEIVQAVASGHADLGIVADSTDLSGVETAPFRNDQLVLVHPAGHPLAGRPGVSFREALELAFVGLARGSALQEHLDIQAARLGARLRYRLRLRGFDDVCLAVERGMGVAVIPETAARRGMAARALGFVPLKERWAARRLMLCVRRFDELPAYLRDMVASLTAGS